MGNKPSWFYRQSAVIPYRIVEGRIEILLITSINRGRWIIPKGIVEPGLSAAESAGKEAFEEAGVRGKVSSKAIGEYSNTRWGGECRVKVYLMKAQKVMDRWPEKSVRRRQWMKVSAAAKAVTDPKLRKLILKVPDLIEEAEF